MNDRIDKVIALPFHRFLGVTTVESEAGRGKLSVTINENTANLVGVFHGGALYTLCDVCGYCGLLSLIDEKTNAVTHDIQVSVMRAAKLGDVVDFSSEVIKLGKKVCFIDVKVSVAGTLIASARITKSIITI